MLVPLLLTQAAAAPPAMPTVSATAAKTEVTVGEPFVVELKGAGPAGTAWTFPAEAGDEQLELRALAADPQAPPPPGTQRYEAVAFGIADVKVPAVRVSYRLPGGRTGEATSEPIPLQIASLLTRDPEQQKLADIRAPLPLGVGRPFWYALAATLGAFLAGLAWLVRRRRRAALPAHAGEPVRTPDLEALAALDRLEASGSLERADYRAFYIALAEIAKRYLERRLHAPVLEMTSSEAVAFLRGHGHGGALAPVLRELASAADQVKFARGPGQADVARRHLTAVRQLVGVLEARLAAAAASAPAEKVA